MKNYARRSPGYLAICVVLFLSTYAIASPPIPNPVLVFTGSEFVRVNGVEQIRYTFNVFNKEDLPAEMFAAAPNLPPCGSNKNASRTFLDIYDQSGKRLNGFCALGKPSDLDGIWFSLPATETPPSWIYIELNDRQTNTKYKSNLAETVM